jgi:hypothetical protein
VANPNDWLAISHTAARIESFLSSHFLVILLSAMRTIKTNDMYALIDCSCRETHIASCCSRMQTANSKQDVTPLTSGRNSAALRCGRRATFLDALAQSFRLLFQQQRSRDNSCRHF